MGEQEPMRSGQLQTKINTLGKDLKKEMCLRFACYVRLICLSAFFLCVFFL